MPVNDESKLRCLLLSPSRGEFESVRRTIRTSTRDKRIEFVSIDSPLHVSVAETIYEEIGRADLILAVLSEGSLNVGYEIGLAQAAGKPVIFIIDEDVGTSLIAVHQGPAVFYAKSDVGFERLRRNLGNLLKSILRNPSRLTSLSPLVVRSNEFPIVDLERLEPREFENLCFELLTHMGFRRLKWGEEIKEIDAVAALPKKDPDGFEYEELWLVSMGLRAPTRMLMDFAADPEYLIHRILRSRPLERDQGALRSNSPITLLVIQLKDDPSLERLQHELQRFEGRTRSLRSPAAVRLRTWDRQQIVQLIRQFPQLINKYFSEDGRRQSTTRKTLEQLYRENAALNEQNRTTINAYNEEHDKRVRAERDAVWKDVAFTAAHKLGNPIFALETDLQGIKARIENRPKEALDVANEMRSSIEKAKVIIEQFKSLTKAQQIAIRPSDLVPLIRASARVATDNGVDVEVLPVRPQMMALADPTRMTECFDELFANSLHWLDKPHKKILVRVDFVGKKDRPASLDNASDFIRVRFEDNGCGVAANKKDEVFAPFYTTYAHGTGLGLALVQRVVEGHGGLVREVGKAGDGAIFEIYLPRYLPKAEEK